MKATLSRSKISGRVRAPSSKSYTIRGLMCAALAPGTSHLLQPLASDDTEAALEVLSRLGVAVRQAHDRWEIDGGRFQPAAGDLYCRESATTLRFMTAIATLLPVGMGFLVCFLVTQVWRLVTGG